MLIQLSPLQDCVLDFLPTSQPATYNSKGHAANQRAARKRRNIEKRISSRRPFRR